MSSIWTPGGEQPINPESSGPAATPQEPSQEEMEAQMEELRRQLANTPAAVVIANHGIGLFELAALHLSNQPPQLDEAQLAIDALNAILEGLGSRLGEQEAHLREGLTQLQMAFVQVKTAVETGGDAPTDG